MELVRIIMPFDTSPFVGLASAFIALLDAVFVGWITEGNLRVVAGTMIGAMAGSIGIWQTSRQRAKQRTHD
jgi:hypothetical protein